MSEAKDLLELILSNFWTWSGTVILILATGVALNNIAAGIRGKVVKFQ